MRSGAPPIRWLPISPTLPDRTLELDALAVGLPVQVTFEEITDEIALPRFRPIEG